MRLATNHQGDMGVKPLGNALHTMALFTEAPERELHGAKQHIAVQEDCVGFSGQSHGILHAADNKKKTVQNGEVDSGNSRVCVCVGMYR